MEKQGVVMENHELALLVEKFKQEFVPGIVTKGMSPVFRESCPYFAAM